MTPVTIIGGFLGAGKTTLVRRVLKEPEGRRLGVLVNDFGALNIDAEVISEILPDVLSLKNGCVCCNINADLIGGVRRLLSSKAPPDHIIIETSGVSQPRRVAETFFSNALKGAVELDGIICLPDCLSFPELSYEETEFAIDQAAVADITVLNKIDVASRKAIDEVRGILCGAQPHMRILEAAHAGIPSEIIFGPKDRRRPDLNARRAAFTASFVTQSHGDTFLAWAWQSDHLLDLAAFRVAVKQFPLSVYRAKGLLSFASVPGERALFQLVGKRSSLDFQTATKSECQNSLVTIARRDSFDPDGMQRMLEDCLAGSGSS